MYGCTRCNICLRLASCYAIQTTFVSLREQRPYGLLTCSQPRLTAANLRQIRRLECAKERSDMNASGSINPAIDRFAFRLVCLCTGICMANTVYCQTEEREHE